MSDITEKKHEALGLRLKIAVLRQYRSSAPFIEILEEKAVTTKAAFYYHQSGDRRPDAKILRRYEELLGTPPGWIRDGADETLDELRAAYDAVTERKLRHPSLVKLLSRAGFELATVNQTSSQIETFTGKFSKIRHIPILSNDEISVLVSREKDISAMTAQTWPIDAGDSVGPRAFIFTMPKHDYSMTAAGLLSFAPGTRVLIDPDATAEPGQYILVRNRSKGAWVLRRYKAAGPFGEVTEYTLESMNPSYEPTRVQHPEDGWQFGGVGITVLLNLP